MAGQDKYYLLIKNLPDAFSYHRLLLDSEGNPVDALLLEVNAAFEEITGLIMKQTVTLGA